jgi:hypothetical protein
MSACAVSLGTRPIGASDRRELGSRCTASDRHGPCDTAANGPVMARDLMALETDLPSGCRP